ncbi:hypothetical protein TrispH2_008128, partial [Trichoplax sp. H2]
GFKEKSISKFTESLVQWYHSTENVRNLPRYTLFILDGPHKL